MIKWTILAKAKSDIHEQRFYYHWRMIHAPLALRMSRMRRYVQNHCIEPSAWGLAEAGINGIVECWFDDLYSALQTLAGPEYQDYAQKDEPNLGNPEGSSVFFMREDIVKGASDAELDGMAKAMLFLDRDQSGQLEQPEVEAVKASLQTLANEFAAIELSLPLPDHQHGRSYKAMVSFWLPGPQALANDEATRSRVRSALADHFDLERSTSFLAEPYVLRAEGTPDTPQAKKHLPV
jgi:uncharacterized protein (TIGR02118 family)